MRTLIVLALFIAGLVILLATLASFVVGFALLVKLLSKRNSGT